MVRIWGDMVGQSGWIQVGYGSVESWSQERGISVYNVGNTANIHTQHCELLTHLIITHHKAVDVGITHVSIGNNQHAFGAYLFHIILAHRVLGPQWPSILSYGTGRKADQGV